MSGRSLGRHEPPSESSAAPGFETQAAAGGGHAWGTQESNAPVPAGDRKRLEHLCRYVLRPPVAQDALELTSEGKVLLRLRTSAGSLWSAGRAWRDGTRAIRFEPSELLEKLAAMVPRRRANLLLYHGAFAPRGYCREGTDPWSNEESTRNGVTALCGEGACAPPAEPLAAAAPAARRALLRGALLRVGPA